MKEAKQITEGLKKNGYRMTKIRLAVIELFCKKNSPISAKFIGEILRKNFPSINKTTFYRELLFLKKAGVIKELKFPNERKARYELNAEHHHHLICLSCGKVQEIEFPDLEKDLDKKQKNILKSRQFEVLEHNLEFLGYCLSCK